MPQLRFSGIEENAIIRIKDKLIQELCQVTNKKKDSFALLVDNTTQLTPHKNYVYVTWFPQEQDVQDKVAETIFRLIMTEGIHSVDVIFNIVEGSRYYTEGLHY